jgi:hypothetical protein
VGVDGRLTNPSLSDARELDSAFLGGDPVAGAHALEALVSLGDEGEARLFAGPIAFPSLYQHRRRWLRYVASRPETVAPRLLDRLADPKRFKDRHAAAFLCAGLHPSQGFQNALFEQLQQGFSYSAYYDFADRYAAWGYAGGDASALWHAVRGDHFKWEKLRTFAFRAGCASCARINAGDLFALEQLVTHQWDGYEGLVEIANDPASRISNESVHAAEIATQAYDAFLAWRRGEVADEVLRRWSTHEHWRVREFGAQILASLGFQRTVGPVAAWLGREPVMSVRSALLHALERSTTAEGADALLAFFADCGEGGLYLAKAAWRARDRSGAIAALHALAEGDGAGAVEALVSLARLGERHAALAPALESHDEYARVNATLAFAYLADRSVVTRLEAMQREAASATERVTLAAALAMLGAPDGAARLHRQLVAAAAETDYFKRLDLFAAHRFLQDAVLDGLAAGDEASQVALEAWRGEIVPLDPIAAPVAPASLAASTPRAPQSVSVAAVSTADGSAANVGQGPLKVFVSYSHRDEKMRKRLQAHLASLVNAGLIAIWHDREIEAGADWKGEIEREIDEADLILLLVSATFLDSPYCRNELVRALARRSRGKVTVVPIILRPCDWESVFNAPDYKAQALPRDDRPVAGGRWPNQDAAFTEVAKELRRLVERLRA